LLFLDAAATDGRLQPTHITVFLALLVEWRNNNFDQPFPLKRPEVIRRAMISSRSTYQRRIQELRDFGYISYHASCNRFGKTMFELMELGVVNR
jgi:hypothetical protein